MQSYDNRLDDLHARRAELFDQLRQSESQLAAAQPGPESREDVGRADMGRREGGGDFAAAPAIAMTRAKIAHLDAQIAQLRGRNG
jgi:hypothetical protein